MNTHARHAMTAALSYGAAATWCAALACAALAYYVLDPAATARATLNACITAHLAERGSAAKANTIGKEDGEQAFSAAVYACSTQP